MDPTLLPEPNHVVLNHTFTLSIRVSILSLSAILMLHSTVDSVLNTAMLQLLFCIEHTTLNVFH